MKLAGLKKQLTEVRPFIIINVKGVGECLMAEDADGAKIPLSVALTPPSVTFIVESQQMTTAILRYSETYRQTAEDVKKLTHGQKSKVAEKVFSEMKEKIMKSPADQAEQISILMKLGKEYFITKTIRGWYGDEKDNFKLEFHRDKAYVDKFNTEHADDDSILLVCIDQLAEMEIMEVALSLTSAIDMKSLPPEIPVSEPALETEDGEIVGEGVENKSVSADKFADFPRNTRSLTLADAPRQRSEDIGRDESLPSVGD